MESEHNHLLEQCNTVSTHAPTPYTHTPPHHTHTRPHRFNGAGKDTLLVFSLGGFVFFDLVYVGAVINYAAQSEMNIYLLRAIRRMVVQKFYEDIDAGIKVLISALKLQHCI